MKVLVFALALGFCPKVMVTQSVESLQNVKSDYAQHVKVTINNLMREYDTSTGLWRTEGWWNAANSVTVLGEAAALNPTIKVDQTLSNTLDKAQKKFPLFRNEFYDDEGWWALAWIQAYDLTHDKKFLVMSDSIFRDMKTGWDDTCGGGIWWKKDRRYKNAIANELFLSVAAHLANRTSGSKQAEYAAWAKREWRWFDTSGMINDDSLINDGLTPDCKNNRRNAWTYNQGVILGGLVELARATGLKEPIKRAEVIATAAINRLSDGDHILHDRTEPNCSADTVQFKGIFVRNLAQLQNAIRSERNAEFLHANADAIWSKARAEDGSFACRWSGPPKSDGAGATTSALDAFVAAER